MPSTIRDILNIRPRNLKVVIFATLEVKVIDKENDRMFRRVEEPIPAFILLYHYPNEFPHYPTMDYLHATVPQVPLIQPTPLAMLPLLKPIRMVGPSMDCQWEEFEVKVKRSNDNFKDEVVCRNPSFGLATKAKGVARLRAKRKEARDSRQRHCKSAGQEEARELRQEEARELRQKEARELRQEEARESHHILPGMQESARECEKVLESVRE